MIGTRDGHRKGVYFRDCLAGEDLCRKWHGMAWRKQSLLWRGLHQLTWKTNWTLIKGVRPRDRLVDCPPQFHQTQVAWGNLLLWNVLLLPRDDCFLTVVDGKLTAMDDSDYEVLGEDSIWRRHEFDGEKRAHADNSISYALLPTSSGTAWENMAVRQTMKYGSNLTIFFYQKQLRKQFFFFKTPLLHDFTFLILRLYEWPISWLNYTLLSVLFQYND